jgi:hypothetical protein
MGKAIGGYVRRCERKPFYEPKHVEYPWGVMHFVLPSGAVVSIPKEAPSFQSMPILRFEEFDVT